MLIHIEEVAYLVGITTSGEIQLKTQLSGKPLNLYLNDMVEFIVTRASGEREILRYVVVDTEPDETSFARVL